MKRSLRSIVYLMIVLAVAASIYLWSQGNAGEEILKGMDPESFDVETVCTKAEGNMLFCNGENDAYLYLDGTKVYKEKIKTEVKENGDEEIKVSYKNSSVAKLQKLIKDKGEAHLHIWLTKTGKVKAMTIVEKSFENNNVSMAYLNGLDPDGYTNMSVILDMNKKNMTLAPMGYTEEEKDKYTGLINSFLLAGDAEFYTETVTISVEDDGARKRNIRYGKTSYDEVKKNFAEGISAYIWLDEANRISAVMIHEEKIVLK